MKSSESINNISAAIIQVQGNVKTVVKDGVNPFFQRNGKGTPYATLDAIIEALRDLLLKNKLSVIFAPAKDEDGLILLTRIQHESGEYFENILPLMVSKNDMQGFLAAVTYAKRISLGAFFNIATEVDDDGNKAAEAAPKSAMLAERSARPYQQKQPPAPVKQETKPEPQTNPEPQAKSEDANEKIMKYAISLGVANQLDFNVLVIGKYGKPVNFNEKTQAECKEFCEYLKTKVVQ